MNRGHVLGLGLLLIIGGVPLAAGNPQVPGTSPAAETAGEPLPPRDQGNPASPDVADEMVPRALHRDNQPVKPMTEGPLHEAFLSPRKDRKPVFVQKTPPAPINERPAVDPPSANATWIEGYWEWDPGRKDYVWVTGTWRISPPGRFWVNGYWKRDQQGWDRVPGFWTDRQTDRLDYRKNGPPRDRPDDEPGEPPSADCFFVPGQYRPDGDGVVWKKGFWAKVQPGWAWVPSQWNRQPEGWVFQDGYWDRTLEGRGTLFAPAQLDKSAKPDQDLTYQPYTQVSPEMYGQLYGAFGRPNSYYDGYPGVYYDQDGRFYGYANYGTLGGYYGYLDYPYYGGYGYPYISTPVDYGYGYGGYGDPYGYGGYGGYGYGGYGLGLGMCGGLFNGMFSFGNVGYPWYGGLGYPYGGYGGWGYGGLGYGGLGFGFGYPFWGLGGLGRGGWGWGGMGWGGWGWGGMGWGGWGWGGYGRWCNHYPYHPGGGHHRGGRNGGHGGGMNGMGGRGANGNLRVTSNVFRGQNSMMGRNLGQGALAARHGVQSPPSSRPYGNPFHQGNVNQAVNRAGARQGQIQRDSSMASGNNAFRPSFNGVNNAATHHTAARPAFTGNAGALGGRQGQVRAGGLGQAGQAGLGRGGPNMAPGLANQAGGSRGIQPGQGRGNLGGVGGGLPNAGAGRVLGVPARVPEGAFRDLAFRAASRAWASKAWPGGASLLSQAWVILARWAASHRVMEAGAFRQHRACRSMAVVRWAE